jgi:hypothetical protein
MKTTGKVFDYSQIRALVKSRNFTDLTDKDSGVFCIHKRYFVVFKGEIVYDYAGKQAAFKHLAKLHACQ